MPFAYNNSSAKKGWEAARELFAIYLKDEFDLDLDSLPLKNKDKLKEIFFNKVYEQITQATKRNYEVDKRTMPDPSFADFLEEHYKEIYEYKKEQAQEQAEKLAEFAHNFRKLPFLDIFEEIPDRFNTAQHAVSYVQTHTINSFKRKYKDRAKQKKIKELIKYVDKMHAKQHASVIYART